MDEMVELVTDREGDLFISDLVALEVVRCFARLHREKRIDRGEYERLVTRFEIDYEDLFAVVSPTRDKARNAFQRAIGEPAARVGSADRLHIEDAVESKYFEPPQPIRFVTSDRPLYEYARDTRKLLVWDPVHDGLELLVRHGWGA